MAIRNATTTLIALVFILASLVGCGPPNPFERKSTHTRWIDAVRRGDFRAAEGYLLAQDGPAWRTAAERLAAQHGRVVAIQSGDVVPGKGPPFRSVRVTWASGYERCLRFDLPIGERIDILDRGWQDCAGVQFNPTPGP